MALRSIQSEISAILRERWDVRDGHVVPDTTMLALRNQGVHLDATVLYADLADSTTLVSNYREEFAAEIYKSFLVSACRIIREESGEITAFDGDRVMAIFLGKSKNTLAARAGLKIHFVVNEINRLLAQYYPSTSFKIAHAVGIDTGKLLAAKTGIVRSNDLIWVGRAANFAAKLSTLRDPGYPTFITESVYTKLHDTTKFGGSPRRNMWERRLWSEHGVTLYRSQWWWEF